jgi:serine/threonine protein kinase
MNFKIQTRPNPIFESMDEFSLNKVLGTGAFADVYEATHTPTGDKYAVKRIDFKKISILDRENVEKELEVHVGLDYEFIVRMIDFILETDVLYMILEICSNGNLYRYMNRRKLRLYDIKKIFRQTCLAIQYLHSFDIIMRDLKPENIILDDQNNIKMCDFGWAAKEDDVEYCKIKAGTYAYMSPESLLEQIQTKSSDIWSLGVFLYELYYNKEVFPGEDGEEVMAAVIKNDIQFTPEIDSEGKELILSLLKYEIKDRPTIQSVLSHSYFQSLFDVGFLDPREKEKKVQEDVQKGSSNENQPIIDNVKEKEDDKKNERIEKDREKSPQSVTHHILKVDKDHTKEQANIIEMEKSEKEELIETNLIETSCNIASNNQGDAGQKEKPKITFKAQELIFRYKNAPHDLLRNTKLNHIKSPSNYPKQGESKTEDHPRELSNPLPSHLTDFGKVIPKDKLGDEGKVSEQKKRISLETYFKNHHPILIPKLSKMTSETSNVSLKAIGKGVHASNNLNVKVLSNEKYHHKLVKNKTDDIPSNSNIAQRLKPDSQVTMTDLGITALHGSSKNRQIDNKLANQEYYSTYKETGYPFETHYSHHSKTPVKVTQHSLMSKTHTSGFKKFVIDNSNFNSRDNLEYRSTQGNDSKRSNPENANGLAPFENVYSQTSEGFMPKNHESITNSNVYKPKKRYEIIMNTVERVNQPQSESTPVTSKAINTDFAQIPTKSLVATTHEIPKMTNNFVLPVTSETSKIPISNKYYLTTTPISSIVTSAQYEQEKRNKKFIFGNEGLSSKLFQNHDFRLGEVTSVKNKERDNRSTYDVSPARKKVVYKLDKNNEYSKSTVTFEQFERP